MRWPRRLLVLLLLALALRAQPAGAGAVTEAGARPPSVILLSFDGTRPADLRGLPTFARIAEQGASASLVPAFPSNTFPNHVTFATGVAPDRHGIVNNRFEDPVRGRYDYDGDPSWIEVEPIWSLAARAGVVSASYHWVGSEGPWRSGLGPRHWMRFDSSIGESAKVEQILAWLALPDPAERPRLITAWFHGADAAAHRFGPGAPEVAAALAPQDAALAALLDGLAARDLLASTTVIVVSDHGMAATSRSFDLAGALADAEIDAAVVGGGGFAQIVCAAAAPDCGPAAVRTARAAGLEAWSRGGCPDPLACANPRFGDAVVLAAPGVRIASTRGWLWMLSLVGLDGYAMRGIHGHRPELPEMAAILAAIGRGVAPGARPGTVRAVDVAPTVLALLDVPRPAWMEGQPIPLAEGAPR